MTNARIIADEDIPLVEEAFGQFGAVDAVPGRAITAGRVQQADVLLVRSVTSVDAGLLDGSEVQFVGSATTGTDHVDRPYLEDRGITFAHAPASNADSVADYVVVALLALARRKGVSIEDRTVGIIGCGNIGGRLAKRLSALGMGVLCNDPPRAEAHGASKPDPPLVDLETVQSRADVITLHVPLTTGGRHPTRHLVDAAFLDRLHPGTWLVNTSRGCVVDGDALRSTLVTGSLDVAVLDVWENEPAPDPALIEAVDLATSHIAGYAYDGKLRGTRMLYEALCDFTDAPRRWNASAAIQPMSTGALCCTPPDPRLPPPEWLYHMAIQGYDIRRDDAEMRVLADLNSDERATAFSRLRSDYRKRRELQQHWVHTSGIPTGRRRALHEGLTIQPRELN